MQQIVIVEDDRGLSVGLGKALRGEGRTVCECYSLREARQQLALGDPALVLLDVGLPDGSGLELLREIRARTASLPVILLTANDTDAEVVEGLESGFARQSKISHSHGADGSIRPSCIFVVAKSVHMGV